MVLAFLVCNAFDGICTIRVIDRVEDEPNAITLRWFPLLNIGRRSAMSSGIDIFILTRHQELMAQVQNSRNGM